MNECGFPLGAHYIALLPCPNILQLSSSPSHFRVELYMETTSMVLSCEFSILVSKRVFILKKAKPPKTHCSGGCESVRDSAVKRSMHLLHARVCTVSVLPTWAQGFMRPWFLPHSHPSHRRNFQLQTSVSSDNAVLFLWQQFISPTAKMHELLANTKFTKVTYQLHNNKQTDYLKLWRNSFIENLRWIKIKIIFY